MKGNLINGSHFFKGRHYCQGVYCDHRPRHQKYPAASLSVV